MNFFRRLFSQTPPSNAKDEWLALRKKYAFPIAPNAELATTQQERVVCCASVLDAIWNRNGGAGWGESDEADHIAPLREVLATDETFSALQRDEIGRLLDEIAATGRRNLAEEEKGEEDSGYEGAGEHVSQIVHYVILWCRHHPAPLPLDSGEEYRGHD